jgi:hypothetical protein
MEKPNSAQLAQADPISARLPALTGGPRLWAYSARALTPLSPSRCPVGQCYRRRFSSRALSLSMSRGPHPSAVPNLSPTSSSWTRPRQCVLRPPPHALAPLELAPCSRTPPAHLRPQPSSLALRAQPNSSTAAHRRSPSFRDRRWVLITLVPSVSVAASPAARDTLWFVLSPSSSSGPCSPEHFLRSRSPSSSTRDFTASPSSSWRSWVCTCGEQPPYALNSFVTALAPAQFLARVDPRQC